MCRGEWVLAMYRHGHRQLPLGFSGAWKGTKKIGEVMVSGRSGTRASDSHLATKGLSWRGIDFGRVACKAFPLLGD